VRARISALASLSMARAAAELDVPLHGARGGAPCLSMSISMARTRGLGASVWCLPRAMRLPPRPGSFSGATPASAFCTCLARLRQTAGYWRTAQRLETGRFQFQFLISRLTCKVLQCVRTFLQKQICSVAASLNSGRREFFFS
jgi:hypothetical protein